MSYLYHHMTIEVVSKAEDGKETRAVYHFPVSPGYTCEILFHPKLGLEIIPRGIARTVPMQEIEADAPIHVG